MKSNDQSQSPWKTKFCKTAYIKYCTMLCSAYNYLYTPTQSLLNHIAAFLVTLREGKPSLPGCKILIPNVEQFKSSPRVL